MLTNVSTLTISSGPLGYNRKYLTLLNLVIGETKGGQFSSLAGITTSATAATKTVSLIGELSIFDQLNAADHLLLTSWRPGLRWCDLSLNQSWCFSFSSDLGVRMQSLHCLDGGGSIERMRYQRNSQDVQARERIL
jgi:hypothetical protein